MRAFLKGHLKFNGDRTKARSLSAHIRSAAEALKNKHPDLLADTLGKPCLLPPVIYCA